MRLTKEAHNVFPSACVDQYPNPISERFRKEKRRARMLVRTEREGAAEAMKLADTFCRMSRRRVADLFKAISRNDDVNRHEGSDDVLAGKHEWLERGIEVPWPEPGQSTKPSE